LLPVADVVLYVGSQEKYHDRLGWELFLQQRKRRAVSFGANNGGPCPPHPAAPVPPAGGPPRDPPHEGVPNPLALRPCAQPSCGRAKDGTEQPAGSDSSLLPSPSSLPEGEQFQDLVRWLEMGLTRLEVEAIKARGVSQMLHHLERALAAACPPDLA